MFKAEAFDTLKVRTLLRKIPATLLLSSANARGKKDNL